MTSFSAIEKFKISRETVDLLEYYVELLTKWNKSINLVSSNSLKDCWKRHIEDSLQLWRFVHKDYTKWVDFGSGAGFPGLVIALLALEKLPSLSVKLIESDKRKCVFLGEASRVLGVKVEIFPLRIENVPSQNADVVSARALCSLKELLFFSKIHRKKNGISLFFKGKNLSQEIKNAIKIHKFDHTIFPSLTDKESYILRVENHNYD